MAATRGKGRANAESTKGMPVPGFAHKGGNVGATELASGVDRMGKKVTRLAAWAMTCRCGWVRVGR